MPADARPRSATLSEDRAALAFAERFGETLRFDHHRGVWLTWTGAIWRPDETQAVVDAMRGLVRVLAEDATSRSRAKAEKRAFIAGVEGLCRTDRAFARTSADFDRDPFLLGTPEGTVDLNTGELRPAAPEDGITRAAAVAPSPEADCPRWRRFLADAVGGDEELIVFLQRWAGYGLTGDTREHALVFIYGDGGNGKSVFQNTITGILGAYAATAAMETFTAAKSERHPTDLAMLRGARLVTASETEEGRAWAESRIKALTGGDPITARFMRQDFFTYQPQFKLTIVGNHKPLLHNIDDAARRRLCLVPFTRKPPEPDRELEAKLRTEWPGILRWMIEGCLDWRANGLPRASAVVAATDDYFADQDLVGQWLDEACVVEIGNSHRFERVAALYESWTAYARRAGEDPGAIKSFSPRLERRGLCKKHTKLGRAFEGIELKASRPPG